MKNLFILFLLGTLFLSCSDDSLNVDEESTHKLEQLLRMAEDDKRVAYSLLSAREKYDVWNKTLNDYSNDDSFTRPQKELIKKLIAKINLDVFSEKSNPEKEGFKNIFVPRFLDDVKKVFTPDRIESVFYRLPERIVKPIHVDPELEKCDCNQGSIFGCGTGQDCKEKDCEGTPTDCGFLLLWECDGLCAIYNDV